MGDGSASERHSPQTVINLVSDKGLKISNIHDGGGVIEQDRQSAIDTVLDEYLSILDTDLECLVFHPPHKKTDDGAKWWSRYQRDYRNEIKRLADKYTICIENIPEFKDYYVPLITPENLYEFCIDNNVFVDIDTTHYAQLDINIIKALQILGNRTKSVHISDYRINEPHVFPGEGVLDLKGFLRNLQEYDVKVITLECTLDKPRNLSRDQLTQRLITAREFLENAIT